MVVHGVAKSQTRLNDFPFTFHFHALEEEMATHSSTLVWRIPWTEDPGGCLHHLHCRQILYPLSYLESPLSYYSSHYKVKKKNHRKIMSLDKSPGNLLGHSDSPQLTVSRAVLPNLSVVKDHRRFYKI